MIEREIYQFYNDYVKIVYSEIEARNNTLPVELLFEIHSAFDHLKRFYIDGESEDACCQKAFSHLKRGILDAFKLKLKYFNDDCNKILHKKADLRIIDSGTFLLNFLNDRKTIMNVAKKARLEEFQKDIEKVFDSWCKTSNLIDIFEEKYFDPAKIKWAERQSFFRFGVNFFIGVITGVIGSILVTIIL